MLIGSYAARPWFTFLDDIMPASASRRYWVQQLGEGGHYQWQQIADALSDLVPSDRLRAELASLAHKLTGLKERLQQRGVPASILTMPALGFDYLDQRIEGWQL